MKLSKEKVLPIIINALKEDIGAGDITTSVVFESDVSILAHIVAKEDCVLAGMDAAKWALDALDEKLIFTAHCKDGDRVKGGKRIISIKGSARSILSAERTVLNFLGHLSGIATLTAEYVKEVKGTKARIYDTRKTAPGLRDLEKYAVVMGGGFNYRIGLWGGIMIKDSHIDGSRLKVEGSRVECIKKIIDMFKSKGHKNIEVEVENLKEFQEALKSEADIILLDNMKIDDIRKAVKLKGSKSVELEASGGISLENIRKIAKTGVNRISIGKLTHSAPSIDFSLEI